MQQASTATPVVGRDAELTRLSGVLERARGGEARAVLIAGDAFRLGILALSTWTRRLGLFHTPEDLVSQALGSWLRQIAASRIRISGKTSPKSR